MTGSSQSWWRQAGLPWLGVIARWAVGVLFIYMGLQKALDPVGFLKLVRQYDIIEFPWLLNLVAATLPWFEVFCGVLLLAGIAVRGAAAVSLAMLVPFTVIVWLRAVDLQSLAGIPFCAVRFDCGCGAGEVAICWKLAENLLVIGLAALFVVWRNPRCTLKYRLLGGS